MTIKNWTADDKPREKMLSHGSFALTDAELIAILLGSGTPEENVLMLAQRILLAAQNNLYNLGRLRLQDLKSFKGIGDSKAVALLAALELGRRKSIADTAAVEKISCSGDAFSILSPLLGSLEHEEFWCIFLNNSNKCLRKVRISQGGITSTSVDGRIIYKNAFELNATSIVLAHNHPSGALKPSESDIALTKKLVTGSKLLDLRIIDHIIVTNNGYYSFADEGLI